MKHRIEYYFQFIEEFKNSDVGIWTYCNQKGLPASSFAKALRLYKKSNRVDENKFIEVKINDNEIDKENIIIYIGNKNIKMKINIDDLTEVIKRLWLI